MIDKLPYEQKNALEKLVKAHYVARFGRIKTDKGHFFADEIGEASLDHDYVKVGFMGLEIRTFEPIIKNSRLVGEVPDGATHYLLGDLYPGRQMDVCHQKIYFFKEHK